LLLPNMVKLLILGAIFMVTGYLLYEKRVLKGE